MEVADEERDTESDSGVIIAGAEGCWTLPQWIRKLCVAPLVLDTVVTIL